MNRREFLKYSGAGCGLFASNPSGILSSFQTKSGDLPNIVLIVADDQGYADLSCAGLAKDVSTPNIDRLAGSGIRFTQAYASSPICSPSRSGLITGCYQQRWGTYWYGGPGLHDPAYKTVPELLKQKGYSTGYVGKVHYGSHDSDPNHRSFPLNHGFDYYYGHTSARKHYLYHNQEREDRFQRVKKEHKKRGQSLRQQALWENKKRVNIESFSTELFGKKACDFIRKNNKGRFFLQLSFNAVHNFTHQLPEEYLKKHGLNGYHDWDPATEEYYDWYKAGRKPNNPEGRAQYLGQLYYLDREIGRVNKCLADEGLDKNTVVIYIGDNGGSTPIYANNYPLRGSKYLMYEGGIRVPMLISYPGVVSQGTVVNNVVSGMDILPTICSLAGIKIPGYVNGINLTPLLDGSDNSIFHETLVWDTGHETAVRHKNWKLRTAAKDNHAKYEMVDLELGEFLYDLEKDPGETTNLAQKHPEIFRQLKTIYIDWKRSLNSGI